MGPAGAQEWFGGGYDHAGIHSIVVDPRDPAHVTLAVSCAGVWQTRDGGATWTSTSQGMDAGAYMPPERRYDGNIQDVHRISACAARPDVLWAQHHCGMYRSTDGGLHWRRSPHRSRAASASRCRRTGGPADRLVRAGAFRCAADAGGRPDGGDRHARRRREFPGHGEGLPARDAYHLVYRHGLACAADGQTLALGSTTGGLWISEDGGERWVRVARPAADRGGAVRVGCARPQRCASLTTSLLPSNIITSTSSPMATLPCGWCSTIRPLAWTMELSTPEPWLPVVRTSSRPRRCA